ncbi:MAG: hypothetical protein L0099_00970 [Acidobacteria bacterium]|nr:hypothetical protein [Acidobacteriota bacterium]
MKVNRSLVLTVLLGFMVVGVFFQLASTQTQVTGPGRGTQWTSLSVSSLLQTQAVSSNARVVGRIVANPAVGDYLNVNAGATNRVFFERAEISVEGAVAQVDVILTSAAGVTCTALTAANLFLPSTGSNATVNHTCTTDPVSIQTIMRASLAANSSYIVDLTGFVANNGSADGVSFSVVTSPGAGNDLSVTVYWRECGSNLEGC